MNKSYYKSDKKAIPESIKQRRIQLSLDYRASKRWVNEETGEIKEPFNSRFNAKSAKAIQKKLSNPNSVVNVVRRNHEDNLRFYTVNLADVYLSWGNYDSVFDEITSQKVKLYFKRHIKGSFFGNFELSSYAGPHLHLACKEQDSVFAKKYLKAVREVYDFEGLVRYMSKSPIAEDDMGTEHADEIQGTYLECKARIIGKRAPALSFWRTKE